MRVVWGGGKSSSQFKGKTTLMRHRLANTALKEEIAQVHAWTQKCMTEEEWEKRKELSSP